jgi:cytochrome c-type biogenesis protein CcmH/NrfG
MRRDTLAFTVAGIVFGFVLGYMSASWGSMPPPVQPAPAASASAGATPAAATPTSLDPNEVQSLESLAARSPGDAGARIELGNMFMDHQRWDEAIRWYREALAIRPDQPDVVTDLGACLVSSGRPAEGLVEFEKTLKLDPSYRNALYNKGVALKQMGRPAEAAAVFEDLMKRHPDDPQMQSLRAEVDMLRGAVEAKR